jgi:superfamily II DNA or RNA helicase
MSCKIQVGDLDERSKQKIHTDLTIKLENNKYQKGAPPRYFYPYTLTDDHLTLPFAYAYKHLKRTRPSRSDFPKMTAKFEGTLRAEQAVTRGETIKILEKTGCAINSMYCGFGKTIGAINLACTIKFKTLIIVNRVLLIKQWAESIAVFAPTAVVQKLTPKVVMKEADFYIINVTNVAKRPGEFEDIGMLIVDEGHQIMAEKLSRCMDFIHPRYSLCLTATPYRNDGLDILLELYFGLNKVVRELQREHTVYEVTTGFKPDFELAANGKVNWSTVLDSQAQSESRNEMILNILQKHKDRTFLVLVKRVFQGQYLVNELKKRGESVTSLLGKNQEYDKTARILVGTNSKVGTGFDHKKLDAMLLAGDVESYFIQYLGRPMRTQEVVPLIFDLVDNNPILTKHYATRRAAYLKHGGSIKPYSRMLTHVE